MRDSLSVNQMGSKKQPVFIEIWRQVAYRLFIEYIFQKLASKITMMVITNMAEKVKSVDKHLSDSLGKVLTVAVK